MNSEKKRIYPSGARQNYNASLYADIAIRNYVRAKEQFNALDFTCDGFEEDLAFDLFIEYSISTIVIQLCALKLI